MAGGGISTPATVETAAAVAFLLNPYTVPAVCQESEAPFLSIALQSPAQSLLSLLTNPPPNQQCGVLRNSGCGAPCNFCRAGRRSRTEFVSQKKVSLGGKLHIFRRISFSGDAVKG